MKEPVGVLREVVLLTHEQSVAQLGGSSGLRDEGLMDSALGKPQNLFVYGKPVRAGGERCPRSREESAIH